MKKIKILQMKMPLLFEQLKTPLQTKQKKMCVHKSKFSGH